eukprot:jgi/Bigna1/140197/aug1.54_g14905
MVYKIGFSFKIKYYASMLVHQFVVVIAVHKNHDQSNGPWTEEETVRTQSLEWRDLVAATRVWRQSKLCTIFKKMRINAQRRILWKKKWSRKLRYWGNLVHLTFRCPELHGTSEGQEVL